MITIQAPVCAESGQLTGLLTAHLRAKCEPQLVGILMIYHNLLASNR